MVSVVSALNDALIKLVGERLPGIQVAFLRFLFSFLVLLPFVFQQKKTFWQTKYWKIHGLRSLFLFLALAPWCYGVIQLPLSLVTTISFTTPLFVLCLSKFFLKEELGSQRIMATILGFLGILISVEAVQFSWDSAALLLILSTVLFASLDVMNKKLLIKNESLLSMLFFSALGTTLLGFPFAVPVWMPLTLEECLLMACLGVGANLILYCLLKAFQYAELSSLQPMRYVELLISSAMGVLLFAEWPKASTLWGSALIIPATLYITRFEVRRQQKKIKHREAA